MLMHADDIVIIATSKEKCIEKVNTLWKYCKGNYISLQISKCYFLCFNKRKVEDMEPIVIGNEIISMTNQQVYLGSVITDSLNLKDDIDAEIKNRNSNIVKYYAFLRKNKYAPTDIKLMVLDACVLSSLIYNSETWANTRINSLDIKYRKILKAILGVKMSTCNEIVYMELGKVSIQTQIEIKKYKFWKKIEELDDRDPLKQTINEARKQNMAFIKYYDNLTTRYESEDEIKEEFFKDIKTSIRRKASEGRTKCITYMKINPFLVVPEVYNKMGCINIISKLRTSSHDLKIETGRQKNIATAQRTCICGDIEDEEHFTLKCELYRDIRMERNITNQSLNDILEDAKYVKYLVQIAKRRKEQNTMDIS